MWLLIIYHVDYVVSSNQSHVAGASSVSGVWKHCPHSDPHSSHRTEEPNSFSKSAFEGNHIPTIALAHRAWLQTWPSGVSPSLSGIEKEGLPEQGDSAALGTQSRHGLHPLHFYPRLHPALHLLHSPHSRFKALSWDSHSQRANLLRALGCKLQGQQNKPASPLTSAASPVCERWADSSADPPVLPQTVHTQMVPSKAGEKGKVSGEN